MIMLPNNIPARGLAQSNLWRNSDDPRPALK